MRAPIVTMPGKLGDLLFAVPAMRAISRLYDGAPVELVTTSYCGPALSLLVERLPDLISRVYVANDYRPTASAPGIQPWRMTPPAALQAEGHRDVFHLGFRRFAHHYESITETLARHYALTIAPGPWLPRVRVDKKGPVVMHAPILDGWGVSVLRELIATLRGREAIIVGDVPDFVAYQRAGLDREEGVTLRETEDLLAVWNLLDGASQFVGVASAPAVVAAGAGLPCRWVMQPGADHRSVPRGCDVQMIRGKAA